MLFQSFPCRLYIYVIMCVIRSVRIIVRLSRNITDVRCGVIHAGCGIASTSGSESFWDRPSWKPVWLQAVVVLFPSVVGGICLASWIRLVDSLPHHRNKLCPFDVVVKRLVAWWERRTVDLLDCSNDGLTIVGCSQGIFLITTAHAHQCLVPCFVCV